MKLREGSLFSGYNGLGMAVSEVFGSEPAWFSEIEPGPSKILAHHWPEVPNLGDLTTIDWDAVEPVEILSGGFPCQDVSPAGKRAGLRPGTRSGLWNYMAFAVSKLRPRYIVIENVRGLLSAEAHSDVEPCPWCLGEGSGEPDLRALGAVLGDLAELGYDAQWCGLRAADVGAPHGRFRIFVLGTRSDSTGQGFSLDGRPVRGRGLHHAQAGLQEASGGDGLEHDGRGRGPLVRGPRWSGDGLGTVCAERFGDQADLALGDNDGDWVRGDVQPPVGWAVYSPPSEGPRSHEPPPKWLQFIADQGEVVLAGDADRCNRDGWTTAGQQGQAGSATGPVANPRSNGRERGTQLDLRPEGRLAASLGDDPDRCSDAAAHTDVTGLEGRGLRGGSASERLAGQGRLVDWGDYGPAIDRWERTLGRVAPAPTEPGAKGGQRLAPRFVEWMQGLPAGHVTDVPGVNRNAQLKALGNGVVPQQAAAALRHLVETAP